MLYQLVAILVELYQKLTYVFEALSKYLDLSYGQTSYIFFCSFPQTFLLSAAQCCVAQCCGLWLCRFRNFTADLSFLWTFLRICCSHVFLSLSFPWLSLCPDMSRQYAYTKFHAILDARCFNLELPFDRRCDVNFSNIYSIGDVNSDVNRARSVTDAEGELWTTGVTWFDCRFLRGWCQCNIQFIIIRYHQVSPLILFVRCVVQPLKVIFTTCWRVKELYTHCVCIQYELHTDDTGNARII
jgi:hypothetical protein